MPVTAAAIITGFIFFVLIDSAMAVFIKITMKLKPYIPVQPDICQNSGIFHIEYPTKSHGNPVNKYVLTYSNKTQIEGIKRSLNLRILYTPAPKIPQYIPM